jgi:hypothetical protein
LLEIKCCCHGYLQVVARYLLHGGTPQGVLYEAVVDPASKSITSAVEEAELAGLRLTADARSLDCQRGLTLPKRLRMRDSPGWRAGETLLLPAVSECQMTPDIALQLIMQSQGELTWLILAQERRRTPSQDSSA